MTKDDFYLYGGKIICVVFISIVGGIIAIVILFVVGYFLPENFPFIGFSVGYSLAGKLLAENMQMKKEEIVESSSHDFHSNLKVLGIGLLMLLLLSAIILTIVYISFL